MSGPTLTLGALRLTLFSAIRRGNRGDDGNGESRECRK